MSFIQSKLMSIIIASFAFVNVLLACIVFYLLVPLISPTISFDAATNYTDKVMSTLNPDVAIFWQVNLESNSRKAISFRVKDNKDNNAVITYVNVGQLMSFSSALSPKVVQGLLAGQPICYPAAEAGITSSATISLILKNYPDAMVCVSPNQNKAGILNGYLVTIWKKALTEAEQISIIGQVTSVLKQK